MRAFSVFGASLVALAVGLCGQSAAMPQAPVSQAADGLVVQVAVDCHGDVRRHFLPQYDRRVWHRHRQSNCRVVLVDPPQEDPYDGRRDCHREVERHYLPEYGARVTHRHVGPNCRVKVYRQYDGGSSRQNCIRIGVVQFCEQ
jgi:hypothetical protein